VPEGQLSIQLGHLLRGKQDEASYPDCRATVIQGPRLERLFMPHCGRSLLLAATPAHAPKRSAGEELFGIGRLASSAKGLGQCELKVEQTVFAADRTVKASARRDFCGI
jgi:hypothetical protein